MPSVKTRNIKIGVTAPEWMGSEVIVQRLHERVQAILNKHLTLRSPTVQVITTAIVEAYIAGYGDGRGMQEHETDAEDHAQHIADVILQCEGGDDPDHLAIAGFVRRVAGIIEQRATKAQPPAARGGLPS